MSECECELRCICIGDGTEGGGGQGGKRPHSILLGGAMPHTILVANGTIRRNAHTQPPVRSIIIHVDKIFCVKGTGRDSKGWPTIEFAMIQPHCAQSERTQLNTRELRTAPPTLCAHAHWRPHNPDSVPPPMICGHLCETA